MRGKFEKLARVVWILASKDGCVLAYGHPDPRMPQYHLDALTDKLPQIVHADNKYTLRDRKLKWNYMIRRSQAPRRCQLRSFVQERKVRITIEEEPPRGRKAVYA